MFSTFCSRVEHTELFVVFQRWISSTLYHHLKSTFFVSNSYSHQWSKVIILLESASRSRDNGSWIMDVFPPFTAQWTKLRQSRKVIWDMINTLFPDTLSNLLLLLSFSAHKQTSIASRAILLNFFEEEWTQSHPQYLSGLSRTLFPTTFLEIAVYLMVSAMTSYSSLTSRRLFSF